GHAPVELVVVVGGVTAVVPACYKHTLRSCGERRHPLRAGGGIRIEPDRGGPSRAVVGRAGVHNIARVSASAVGSIHIMHYLVSDGGLAPTHVPPDRRDFVEIRIV